MSGIQLTRLAPGGSAVDLGVCWSGASAAERAEALIAGLCEELAVPCVELTASGREALRLALLHAAEQTGRQEVVIPAYVCWSVPAAAVASGLRVRLVDVGPDGAISQAALDTLPLERAAAIVVGNLFGRPEPIRGVSERAAAAGALVVDDAAQAFGARGSDGPAGGRGHLGVLSFGRGKPLCGLGGGALAWRVAPDAPRLPAPAQDRLGAFLRGAAWALALRPAVFRWLAAVPALAIGETRFDPVFERGPIDGASLVLAHGALARCADAADARRERAARLAGAIAEGSGFRALPAVPGAREVSPRLALRAPDAASRNRALARLAADGATAMYPSALDSLAALAPHRTDRDAMPGARDFAARLLTLPTHAGLAGPRLDRVVEALRAAETGDTVAA